ncbi:MAG: hypothetical protein HDS73_08200 [Bacteroidales bacterium]|nr:hypothetical protein [Bacteroidales bacterium]
MKKSILFASLCAGLILTACSTEDPVYTSTQGFNVANLILPINENEDPFVQTGTITFEVESYSQMLKVATSELIINNKNYSFNTQQMSYGITEYGGFSFAAPYVYDGDNRIQSLRGVVTYNINNPKSLGIDSNISGVNGVADFGVACLVQYNIPDVAVVKTIQREAYYAGTVDTSVSGQDPFTSKSAIFRVILDLEKRNATVVVYNAKFNSQMPQLTFVLKDLDLIYTDNGYEIKGEEIVPIGADGSPYPGFPFNTFHFVAKGNDLSAADIDFTVSGRFKGKFSGSFLSQN